MKATIIQGSLVVTLVGLMFILLGWFGAERRETPTQTRTYRPATEQERRQHEVDRLSAELHRIAEQREQRQAAQVPTGYLGY